MTWVLVERQTVSAARSVAVVELLFEDLTGPVQQGDESVPLDGELDLVVERLEKLPRPMCPRCRSLPCVNCGEIARVLLQHPLVRLSGQGVLLEHVLVELRDLEQVRHRTRARRTVECVLVELDELLGSMNVREQSREGLERRRVIGHRVEGAMVVVDRVVDGVESGLVDLGGARVRVGASLSVSRVARLSQDTCRSAWAKPRAPGTVGSALEGWKATWVPELDGSLVPRDRLIDVAELLFVEPCDALGEREPLGCVLGCLGERLERFRRGLGGRCAAS